VRTGDSTANRRARGPADSSHRVEQRRVLVIRFDCCRAHPASRFPLPALQLDVALRRLHVLEQTIDDLLGRDALRFRGKVWKNAMTENRPRDAQNIARRNCEASREESVSLGA
jgi:hypothetical protein